MTVAGNLAFQSGALYLVQVNTANGAASNVTVGGSAALAGTVNAVFASGSYATRTFTILSAAGARGGTTFDALTTSNLPVGFTPNLSYTDTDVILNLTATLGLGTGGLSINQRNVATALNSFFNNGGALPPGFRKRLRSHRRQPRQRALASSPAKLQPAPSKARSSSRPVPRTDARSLRRRPQRRWRRRRPSARFCAGTRSAAR